MGWACKASVLGIGSVWGLVLWAAVIGGVFGADSFFRVGWHGGGGVFLVVLLKLYGVLRYPRYFLIF